MKKTAGKIIPMPEMAKMAFASLKETFDTQMTIAQGDFQQKASQISAQLLKDMGLDNTKADYKVDFITSQVVELPLGTLKNSQQDRQPKATPPQVPVNPAARKK